MFGERIFTSIFVKYFWISENIRGQGLGYKLMARLEQEAAALGVENLYLDTFSFQAPGFYKKVGFKEVGRFTDYPSKGADQIFYQKAVGA